MKKYDVLLTPDAINDLEVIYEYILEKSNNHESAWSYIDKLRHKCYDLSIFPYRTQKRDDIRKNIRIFILNKSTIAAFEVNETQHKVVILNFFHGGQDYETIMKNN